MKSLIPMSVLRGAALAAAALAAQSAMASPTNSKAPFDVTADQLETHSADCVAIYSGSAEALQDNSRLRADTMIAHLEMVKGKPGAGAGVSTGCGAMTTLEAKGNVYYVSGDGRRVHGDNGFYNAANTTITITGDVTAVDGQNVMRGTKMVYNTATGEGHVEGGGKGPNARSRPRGVFYPKDASSQGQPASASASTDKGGDKKKKAAQ